MGTYKQEMDNLKLSGQKKEQLIKLYATETKKEEHSMRRLIKPMVAVAACAAILLGSVVSGNLALKRSADHDFSIMVNAAELTGETPVVAYDPGKGDSWVLCEGEDHAVKYSIEAGFACEGDHIASITYQINRGAFQIFMPQDQSQEFVYTETEEMNMPWAGWRDGDAVYYASAFTVDYAKQRPENINLAICGERQVEKFDELFGDDVAGEKAGLEELLGDVVVTCTVSFADGTDVSKEIVLTPVIMTNREGNSVGSQLDAKEHDGEADFEEFLNKEVVFLVYELR